MLRKMGVGVASVALATGLAACGGGQGSAAGGAGKGAPIDIGSLLSLTGANSTACIPMLHGEQLAVSQINKAGGVTVKGEKHKLTLVSFNAAGKPATGISQVNRMTSQKGIHLMVGIFASAIGSALVPTLAAHKSNLAVIVNGSVTPKLTGPTTPNVFRMGPLVSQYNDESLAWQESAGWKTVDLITETTQPALVAYTPTLLKLYKKAGIDVVNAITVPTQPDYSSIVTRLKNQPVDGVFLRTYSTAAAIIVKDARQQGWNVPMQGLDPIVPTQISKLVPATAMNDVWQVVAPTPTSLTAEKDPKALKFASAYQKQFGTKPVGLSLQAYESVKAMAAAIGQAKSASPEPVMAALRKLKPYGMVLPVSTSGGHVFPASRTASLKFLSYQYKNGKPEVPESIKQ